MVVGAGGHAKVVLDTLLLRRDEFEVACLTDSNPHLHGKKLFDIPIRGDEDCWLETLRDGIDSAIVAVGENRVRGQISHRLKEVGFQLVNAIHPYAYVSPHAELEQGIAVMAGAIIQPGAQIHESAIINTGASIDHDCIIERNVHIAPGTHLGGNVHISEGTLVGIGTSIIPGITIGKWSVIGSGSVVKDDLCSFQLAVGVPARIVKQVT